MYPTWYDSQRQIGCSHRIFTLLFALQMRSGDELERPQLHTDFAGMHQNLRFCILSTQHYLEKSGETFHSLEAGDKVERGQLLTPTVSACGQRLTFPSLSQGCSLEGVEVPPQPRASLAAEYQASFPNTL